MIQKKNIPNPNKLTEKEKLFIHDDLKLVSLERPQNIKKSREQYLRRMLSVPRWFDQQLAQYLLDYPHEGSKSSFIVRIVAEYIKQQGSKL